MEKKIIRFLFLIVVIFYITLYLGQLTGYYKYTDNQKTTLTSEAIKRFEEDVKKGKEIDAKNYLEEQKNYNNKFSRLGMRISNIIEKGFNKTMRSIFNEIDKAVNDK